MGKPTGFMEYDRCEAASVEPKERIKNFNEFHVFLSKENQQKQAARCMDCGVPFCQSGMTIAGMTSGCPLHNLVPEWNDLVYTGNWEQAYNRLHKTNNFPEFTSRVCPALCEKACTCGQYGCLEQYTSATGIVRVAKRKLAKTNDETSLRNFPELTAKDVFDEAKSGDAVALGLVDEVCGILGSTLSNIACVVNPEVVVIGGGVSKAGSILIESIQKHFVETSFHACRNTKFVIAGLGNDAGMYGCVQMLLD
jgi:hypothetical protein